MSGTRPEDNYPVNDVNKRHTMSHPPDHIPDMDTHSPAKSNKSPKIKKDKQKDKVCSFFHRFFLNRKNVFFYF